MISVATILACIFSLILSLILPAVILIVFAAKNKKNGILSAWLLGAAGFVVTQLLIRVPILAFLQGQSWFMTFAQNHLFLYAFSLAFTAGLFELAGRFAVAKLMHKNLTYKRSLAAGLGHGGIEAMVLIGMTYISNLALIFMINSGYFDIMLSQMAGDAAMISHLELIRSQLISYSPAIFLLGGFERILAMICHAAMSILVCYGVSHKRTLSCTLICLGIHTLIDLTAGISLLAGSVLSQTIAYTIIYIILTAAAVVSLLILKSIHSLWQSEPHKEVIL